MTAKHPAGWLLATWINENGLNQRKFAHLLDRGASYVSEVIRGNYKMSWSIALDIEAATITHITRVEKETGKRGTPLIAEQLLFADVAFYIPRLRAERQAAKEAS